MPSGAAASLALHFCSSLLTWLVVVSNIDVLPIVQCLAASLVGISVYIVCIFLSIGFHGILFSPYSMDPHGNGEKINTRKEYHTLSQMLLSFYSTENKKPVFELSVSHHHESPVRRGSHAASEHKTLSLFLRTQRVNNERIQISIRGDVSGPSESCSQKQCLTCFGRNLVFVYISLANTQS